MLRREEGVRGKLWCFFALAVGMIWLVSDSAYNCVGPSNWLYLAFPLPRSLLTWRPSTLLRPHPYCSLSTPSTSLNAPSSKYKIFPLGPVSLSIPSSFPPPSTSYPTTSPHRPQVQHRRRSYPSSLRMTMAFFAGFRFGERMLGRCVGGAWGGCEVSCSLLDLASMLPIDGRGRMRAWSSVERRVGRKEMS